MADFSPRAKIPAYIALVLVVFISHSIVLYLLILAMISPFLFKLPLKTIKKGCLPIVIFLAFTFLSNALFQHGRVIAEILGLCITYEGIERASYLTLRLLILILGARVLTATTPAEDMVKAFGGLLGPVGRLAPVKEFIATTALTLRFLPMIYNEAQGLYKEAMADYPKVSLMDKIKLSTSLLVPLSNE
jgi:energy-coupling factor transport system permease protein